MGHIQDGQANRQRDIRRTLTSAHVKCPGSFIECQLPNVLLPTFSGILREVVLDTLDEILLAVGFTWGVVTGDVNSAVVLDRSRALVVGSSHDELKSLRVRAMRDGEACRW